MWIFLLLCNKFKENINIGAPFRVPMFINIVADVDGNDVVVYIRGINLIYADDGDKTYYHLTIILSVIAASITIKKPKRFI